MILHFYFVQTRWATPIQKSLTQVLLWARWSCRTTAAPPTRCVCQPWSNSLRNWPTRGHRNLSWNSGNIWWRHELHYWPILCGEFTRYWWWPLYSMRKDLSYMWHLSVNKSVAYRKTVVTPLLTHWTYHNLAQSHENDRICKCIMFHKKISM